MLFPSFPSHPPWQGPECHGPCLIVASSFGSLGGVAALEAAVPGSMDGEKTWEIRRSHGWFGGNLFVNPTKKRNTSYKTSGRNSCFILFSWTSSINVIKPNPFFMNIIYKCGKASSLKFPLQNGRRRVPYKMPGQGCFICNYLLGTHHFVEEQFYRAW